MQGTQRYVTFGYLACGLVVWATLAKFLASVAYMLDFSDPALLGPNFTLSTLVGLLLSIGVGAFASRNERISQYSHEVVAELRKVTWPSQAETKSASVVVVVTTILISLALAVFDQVWAKLTGLIYQ